MILSLILSGVVFVGWNAVVMAWQNQEIWAFGQIATLIFMILGMSFVSLLSFDLVWQTLAIDISHGRFRRWLKKQYGKNCIILAEGGGIIDGNGKLVAAARYAEAKDGAIGIITTSVSQKK